MSSSFSQSCRSVVGTGAVVEPVVTEPVFGAVEDVSAGCGVGAGVARTHTRPVAPLLGPYTGNDHGYVGRIVAPTNEHASCTRQTNKQTTNQPTNQTNKPKNSAAQVARYSARNEVHHRSSHKPTNAATATSECTPVYNLIPKEIGGRGAGGGGAQVCLK